MRALYIICPVSSHKPVIHPHNNAVIPHSTKINTRESKCVCVCSCVQVTGTCDQVYVLHSARRITLNILFFLCSYFLWISSLFFMQSLLFRLSQRSYYSGQDMNNEPFQVIFFIHFWMKSEVLQRLNFVLVFSASVKVAFWFVTRLLFLMFKDKHRNKINSLKRKKSPQLNKLSDVVARVFSHSLNSLDAVVKT